MLPLPLPAAAGVHHQGARSVAPAPSPLVRPRVPLPGRAPQPPAQPPPAKPAKPSPWELWLDGEARSKEVEGSRMYRRDLFDLERWKSHRRVDRYWYTISTMFSSRILMSLAMPLAWVLISSVFVCGYQQLLHAGAIPSHLPSLTLNALPFTLTSFALSLLLVFRTNSAYSRFDEARKAWGGILNRCRTMANQVASFVPDSKRALRVEVMKWNVAFIRTMQAHVQEDILQNIEGKLAPWLNSRELEIVLTSRHRVVKTLEVLGEVVSRLPLTTYQALTMRQDITFFYDQLGTCERLLRTPIPLSYTRHTCRFLLIWLTFLPMSLWPVCGWATAPISLVVGMLLLGIEEIGVQIEEPFGVLPLEAICVRAESDMTMQIDDHSDVNDYVNSITDPAVVAAHSRLSRQEMLQIECQEQLVHGEIHGEEYTWPSVHALQLN